MVRRSVSFLIILILLTGCAGFPGADLDKLKPGISKDEFIKRYGQPELARDMENYWIYRYGLVNKLGMQVPGAYYFIFSNKGKLISWHKETPDKKINVHGLNINLPVQE